MREIKFRGIRRDNKEFVYGDGIHFPKSINYKGRCYIDGMQEKANDWMEVMPETVGQYTTIDAYKSNTETENIYKGDIVEIVCDEIGYTIPQNFRGEVKFVEGKWVVDDGKKLVDLWQELAQWIILGNIYENLELLEE